MKWLITIMLGMVLATSCSAEPRGVRNNNPGNIIKTSIPWKGKEECTNGEEKFECFRNPSYGIRAIYKNIVAYQTKYRIREVGSIIQRWTSGDPNHIQGRYATFVASDCGSSYNQSGLSWRSWNICLVRRIIRFENGYNPYSLDYLERVYDSTYGDYHPTWVNDSRGRTEAVGNVSSVKEGPSEAATTTASTDKQRSGTSKGVRESGVHVDKESHSTPSGICRNSVAKDSSSVLAGYTSKYWLDRMAKRLHVLYGGEGGYDLAYRKWTDDNPTGYTPRFHDWWAIFRRELGWA